MQKLIRFLISLVGAAILVGLVIIFDRLDLLVSLSENARLVIYIGAGLIGFVVAFLLAPRWMSALNQALDRFTRKMETVPLSDVIFGTIGLLIGLIIAGLISRPVLQLSMSYLGNFVGVVIAVIIYLVFGLLGIRLATKSKDEILRGLDNLKEDIIQGKLDKEDSEDEANTVRTSRRKRKKKKDNVDVILETENPAKILDTSVIIDGRIFEVIKAGFLEGPFIISHYVLDELQHISDSANGTRRERGRRGLDYINELQTQRQEEVLIDNSIIDQAKEVDAKLLILTAQYKGKIVTNDYNLNKVAQVQQIPVLNVNDLANALKPIVIPGEYMEVEIIKEGKEIEQGLGYLEDGTMIVVENGHDYIGQTVDTVVTSVLQTSAGKMIFTRIED